MWLCSSNSAESIQPSSKHWEEREGARRMGPTTDSTVSGHLRGLLMEKGLLEVQPQAETLLQSGGLQRIQSPFSTLWKIITSLPSSSWIKGKLLFVYTKNAFYGSNLNHSQMKASWKVKWGQLPAASPTTDLTKGHQSSYGVYWTWLPTEHIQEAPT